MYYLMESVVTSLRLYKITKLKLDLLAKLTGKTKTKLLEEAINNLILKYKELGVEIPEQIVKEAKENVDGIISEILNKDPKQKAIELIEDFLILVGKLSTLGLIEIVRKDFEEDKIIVKDSYYNKKLEKLKKEIAEALEKWDKERGIVIYAILMEFMKIYTAINWRSPLLHDLYNLEYLGVSKEFLDKVIEKVFEINLKEIEKSIDKRKLQLYGKKFLLIEGVKKKLREKNITRIEILKRKHKIGIAIIRVILKNIDKLFEGVFINKLLEEHLLEELERK